MAIIKILEINFRQHPPIASNAIRALGAESADYSHVEFTSGYGALTSAGATVQKGMTGHISANLVITSYSEDSYKEVMREITNTVSKEDHEQLQYHLSQRDYGGWWTRLFGLASGHDMDHYTNTDHSSVEITDATIKNSIEQHMSGRRQKFSVTGEFDITGESLIPTTVNLFIKTLQIKTSDGSATDVISNSAAAADSQGNVVPSKGNIKIVHLN